MPRRPQVIANLPANIDHKTAIMSGAYPLANEKWEAYCLERSLLVSKQIAYQRAGFASESAQSQAVNAFVLEKRPEIIARIAHLRKQSEAIVAEKRERLEAWLWSNLEGNIAEYVHTVEVEKLDRNGKVVRDSTGKPVMVTVTRMVDLNKLTPEQQQRIESIQVNNAGIATPKLYSAADANRQLRELHGIGQTLPDGGRRSDGEIVDRLAQLANLLGVKVDISIS